MYQNIDRLLGKKEKDQVKDQWHPYIIVYMIGGIRNLTVSDPEMIADANMD